MTKTMTASELLARIEKTYFSREKLGKACKLKGAERREYVLGQVECLLSKKHGMELMGVYLSDEFWTADDDRMPLRADNPLLSIEGIESLTKEEQLKASLIKDVAGLCHDLSQHFEFDLKVYFGVRNNWWITNKRLVEWLSTTQYKQIAVHTSYIMKKIAINEYEDMHYQPAQDALASLFSRELMSSVRMPGKPQEKPELYVKAIIDEMLRIERHWKQGRRRKLEPEVVILHDEMYGLVPLQFDAGVLKAAQELFEYMDKEVYNRGVTEEVVNGFGEKVKEIRHKHFAKGWIADYSLEIGYLMAHAELCAQGYWQKGDKTL